MQIRLIITVGTFLFGASLTKAGMTWEEWTPENGIVDGQVALQEMLQASQIPDENWQEKAQAFINAFEKLKLQLQFFWRSQVGEGAIDADPWNGIPGGIYSWEEKGYIKRDCPIILHFWLNGHIGKYDVSSGCYRFTCNFPESSSFSSTLRKKIKGNFKKYIYDIFSKKDLKKCALFLNQNFCTPVSKLIKHVIEKLQKQNSLQKEDLKALFSLYGAYDCMDFEYPIVSQANYGQITEAICMFVANCCFDTKQLDAECKAWMIDLFKNYKESPYKEDNFGLGHFNLDLTTILEKFVYKARLDPKKVDADFEKIIVIVIDDWKPQLEKIKTNHKRNENLIAWGQACAALHNAIYN